MHAVPESIVVEVRARILWGEDVEKVRAYLMSKNVGEKDATNLLEEILSERAASIRSDGIGKIWFGSACIIAPIAYYYITHLYLGSWNMKFFAGLIVLAAFGLVKVTSGFSMVLRPRSIRGDLSNGADI